MGFFVGFLRAVRGSGQNLICDIHKGLILLNVYFIMRPTTYLFKKNTVWFTVGKYCLCFAKGTHVNFCFFPIRSTRSSTSRSSPWR